MNSRLYDYWEKNTEFCPVSGFPIYPSVCVDSIKPKVTAEVVEKQELAQLEESAF